MKYQGCLVRSEIFNKYSNSCLILHSEAAVSGKVSCSGRCPTSSAPRTVPSFMIDLIPGFHAIFTVLTIDVHIDCTPP